MSANAFSRLPLKPELLTRLHAMGFAAMTPVQEETLPPLIDGKDVIAQASTGSGKTAAYALACLQRLQPKSFLYKAYLCQLVSWQGRWLKVAGLGEIKHKNTDAMWRRPLGAANWLAAAQCAHCRWHAGSGPETPTEGHTALTRS